MAEDTPPTGIIGSSRKPIPAATSARTKTSQSITKYLKIALVIVALLGVIVTAFVIKGNSGTGPGPGSTVVTHTPTIPRLASVYIPSCSTWSEEVLVSTDAGTVSWEWGVTAQYLWEGVWKDHITDTHVDSAGFRYCSDRSNYVGRYMPLTWR